MFHATFLIDQIHTVKYRKYKQLTEVNVEWKYIPNQFRLSTQEKLCDINFHEITMNTMTIFRKLKNK